MTFIRQVGYIIKKDLIAEFRSKQMLSSMFIFAFIVITIFSFAFDPTTDLVKKVFPGIVWVAFLFAGILGLNRSFLGEKNNDSILGLMLCPADRNVVYVGKMLGNLLFMLIMEAITLPIFFVLYDYKVNGSIALFVLIVFLASFGFIAIGTLLAALTVNTKSSDILLPVILFPLAVPIIIAAVQATGAILGGEAFNAWGHWLKLILAFDLIYSVTPFMLFEFVLEV